LLTQAMASGAIKPLVASPIEAGVMASVAYSGLAGIAVAALRLDLRGSAIGWRHPVALTGLGIALALAAWGVLPALWRGEWAPLSASPSATGKVASLLSSQGGGLGPFRALWVGRAWQPPAPTGSRPVRDYLVTGSAGQSLTDLFQADGGTGDVQLQRAILSVRQGGTDEGGRLLGAFNIAFVVTDRGPEAAPWLGQLDLTLIATDSRFLLFQNDAPLARPGVYAGIPAAVAALGSGDYGRLTRPQDAARVVADQGGGGTYRATGVTGPGVVFVPEAADAGWDAAVGGRTLARVEGGWGNGFALGSRDRGSLRIAFDRRANELPWLGVAGLLWLVVLGSALSRESSPSPRLPS
jgi:hypothetical protein